ncbi:MAG TPA: hypothetical protein VFR35_13035 [Actinoplanes sp.]|nr:hypothetical protein [Actinoplanes sp.]
MRIRTMAGVALATAAAVGAVALGTAAFAADETGSARTYQIDQGTSAAAPGGEDCPERGGSSGGATPDQSAPGESAPGQPTPEQPTPEQSAPVSPPEQSSPEQSPAIEPL